MNLNNVRVHKWDPREGDLGAGFIVINDLIKVTYRIIQGQYGPFITYPSYKGKDNKFYETAGPVSKEAREALSSKILAEHGLGNAPQNASGTGPVAKVEKVNPPSSSGYSGAPF